MSAVETGQMTAAETSVLSQQKTSVLFQQNRCVLFQQRRSVLFQQTRSVLFQQNRFVLFQQNISVLFQQNTSSLLEEQRSVLSQQFRLLKPQIRGRAQNDKNGPKWVQNRPFGLKLGPEACQDRSGAFGMGLTHSKGPSPAKKVKKCGQAATGRNINGMAGAS